MDNTKLAALRIFWSHDYTDTDESKDTILKLAQKNVNELITEVRRLQETIQGVERLEMSLRLIRTAPNIEDARGIAFNALDEFEKLKRLEG